MLGMLNVCGHIHCIKLCNVFFLFSLHIFNLRKSVTHINLGLSEYYAHISNHTYLNFSKAIKKLCFFISF